MSRAIMVMGASLALGYGAYAAAGESPQPIAAATDGGVQVSLAGRWTGHHYGYGVRRNRDAEKAGAAENNLTYDIVACDGGWCGIRVPDDKPCGAVSLHLKPNDKQPSRPRFAGKLELAKGSAEYTVEAWYQPPGETAGEGSDQAHLSFVGDTGGGEMLMMRRSFPFQAELARTGDAVCTLEKATS